MRHLSVALLSLLLATACGSTEPSLSPTGPSSMPGGAAAFGLETGSATLASHAGTGSIVVDNDGADCPNADYNTIQAAVDAAHPGTTILVCAGTYNERVVISTNGLRLLARGAPDTVVLDGNNKANFAGNNAFLMLNVSGVLIEGFTAREYFENIRIEGGSANTVRKNRSTDAGHDPFIVVNSANNVIEQNAAFDNLSGNACGVNVTAGSQGNLVRNNVLTNNNWGIRIQGGADNTVVFGNESRGNRSHGIQNIGATTEGTTIENNRAENNPIGIEVTGSPGVTVARNRAFNNATFDLVDTGVNTTFVNNHCRTSNPAGLCAQDEGASK